MTTTVGNPKKRSGFSNWPFSCIIIVRDRYESLAKSGRMNRLSSATNEQIRRRTVVKLAHFEQKTLTSLTLTSATAVRLSVVDCDSFPCRASLRHWPVV